MSTPRDVREVPGPQVVKVTTIRLLERGEAVVNRLVRQRFKDEIAPHGVGESLHLPPVPLSRFPGLVIVKVYQAKTFTEDISQAKSVLEELPRVQEFKAMLSGRSVPLRTPGRQAVPVPPRVPLVQGSTRVQSGTFP